MELQINKLKQSVIGAINDSELPLSLVSYIVKEILQEIESLRAQDLKKETEALQQPQINEIVEPEIVE